MMPSARPQPNSISRSTENHTALAFTLPSNAGSSTSLVARARASVSRIDDTANSNAPARDTANGLGCNLM
jgi:hypothetical protein